MIIISVFLYNSLPCLSKKQITLPLEKVLMKYRRFVDIYIYNARKVSKKIRVNKMEDNRKEQMEALEILTDFNGRLVKNMTIIVKELSGERLDDTDKFLKSIVDAINWEIQVVNGTIELLNDGKERIDKEEFNRAIVSLNDAISAKEDAKMAEEFKKVIPVFEQLGEAAEEVIG